MPDMHLGKGACVGCVVPTVGAIIPSAVGVVWSRFDNCNFCPVIKTVFTQLYATLDKCCRWKQKYHNMLPWNKINAVPNRSINTVVFNYVDMV